MMTKNKEFLKNFCDQYHINVVNEQRSYRYNFDRHFTDPKDADIVESDRYPRFSGNDFVHDTVRAEYERILVVEIPESSLERLIDIDQRFFGPHGDPFKQAARSLLDRDRQAKQLREQNPAVQAAWEQYSLMLHLASNGQDLS